MLVARRSVRRPLRSGGRGAWVFAVLLIVLVAVSVVATSPPASAATPAGTPPVWPPLPLGYDATLLSNLSAPSLTPGGSGSLSFTVADPRSFAPMTAMTLTLDLYAFNAYPGNATSTIASTGAPVLVTPTTSGTSVNVSMSSLSPGGEDSASVDVATATSTPAGTYAVRTALAFTANGTNYRLESRGWFTASEWAAATELPNGSLTLNLTTLGVSGVTAETAVLVSSSGWDWALGLILGASVVLIGAGAFVYFRRESKSRAGAR